MIYRAALLELAARVRNALTPELLKPEFRGCRRPFAGHCYVASEAFLHLARRMGFNYAPAFIRHEGAPHWFLRGPRGEVVDLTFDQFETPVPYGRGVGKGFLTREPSKRSRIVIERVRATCLA